MLIKSQFFYLKTKKKFYFDFNKINLSW